MTNKLALLLLVFITGCASTSPTLVRYDLDNDEKRLIKVNPIQNKTGDPKYDKIFAYLTGKFIDDIERSGKYKVIDARKKRNANSDIAPDSEAIASVTKIEFNNNCLFGLIAWVNTPTVEVDMSMRVIDIDTGEILSTSSVTENAWAREWVAFYVMRMGSVKSKKQLESTALDNALKVLVNKL
jgi:TolB-like protein